MHYAHRVALERWYGIVPELFYFSIGATMLSLEGNSMRLLVAITLRFHVNHLND